MPEATRSEMTELVLDLVDAMMEDYDTLVEEWGKVPFMYESVSRAQYQQRWNAMTPQQRQQEMARMRGM